MTVPALQWLDDKIPLAVIVAVLAQTAMVLIWAGAVGERLDRLEPLAADHYEVSERVAHLEARAEDARDALTRIETKLDRLIAQRTHPQTAETNR
jgi:glycerate kinase